MSRQKISWRENLVFLIDIVIIILCYIAAFFIRFDGVLSLKYFSTILKTIPLVVVIKTTALIYFKLHKSIREYASIKDLTQIIKAVTVSSVVVVAGIMAFRFEGFPRSIFIIDWLLFTVTLSGVRFAIRISRPMRRRRENEGGHRRKVLIVGAGDAGEMILREMVYRYHQNYEVVGLIDDNPKKYKRRIHGVTVLGARLSIPEIVKKKNVEEIIIAISLLTSRQMRDIVDYCIKSGAKYRTVPNISDLVDGTVKVKELREVRIEDLLGRDEVILDKERISGYIKGKTVLISGAGGSIGSELCRQIVRFSPRELILFEKSENVLFYIDMELKHLCEEVKKVPVIGDICDRKRVKQIFSKYKPQIVFHAAAHKHVPLMEINSMEAIKNNVFGTEILSQAAVNVEVEKFIMLSTDKAVDPTSLMGVSKRIAELYVAAMHKKNRTKFMTVRFGNVLGSDGSVIPTLRKQIAKGGPVTVTHPNIKRYFMTISEAAGLVLEAGFMGEESETFILEMGKPIKIIDLARDLIRLSGLEPDKDIDIVFTGLRPGEKMHEALIGINEKIIHTSNERIRVLQSSQDDGRNIFKDVKDLELIVENEGMGMLVEKLKEIVPTYTPSSQILELPANFQDKEVKHEETDILVADDEKVVREVLGKFLEGKGYNILFASSGKEALGIVKNNNVNIAIVDIRMPGFMDGFKTLRYIKKINENIEVILITGFGTEETRELSSKLGVHAYLEKPFDLLDIQNHVEAILNTPMIAGGKA